ncbi:MAG: hypothetical protein M1819_006596 [Sarea resinae]|nr:MAG: hypothetical protein M1819_006596 [Sarea resinae]
MSVSFFFRCVSTLLVALSLISTACLYLYPVFDGCAFPSPDASSLSAWTSTLNHHIGNFDNHSLAPFRLLALGDPQLEGDSSLPDLEDGYFSRARESWAQTSSTSKGLIDITRICDFFAAATRDDFPRIFQLYRKRLDLLGNDYYLAHIYRMMHWWTKPTHVTVLGDLIGSQWVSDSEFESRGWRFWNRVFGGGRKIEEDVTGHVTTDVLGLDEAWENRIINVAGNHDVGYAGDMTPERLERFARVFGKPNWEIRFQLPLSGNDSKSDAEPSIAPELRIVVLNDLNMDTPALHPEEQEATYAFINNVIASSRPVGDSSSATILLTHVPLSKPPGVCVDSPFFAFHASEYGAGISEQNHLSPDASKAILEGVFGFNGHSDAPGGGMGRTGIILTGHDHEGCDTLHYVDQVVEGENSNWKAQRWSEATTTATKASSPSVREVTVRSMMGDFGGNAGLLSAWFDSEARRWQFEYSTCGVGKQHIWWAIHILDLVTVVVLLWVGTGWARKTLASSSMDGKLVASTREAKSNGHAGEANTIQCGSSTGVSLTGSRGDGDRKRVNR